MKLKHVFILGFAVTLLTQVSCNRKLPCEKLTSDTEYYRASGVAYSSKEDLAYEKAMHIAKRNLIKVIAKDVSQKSGAGEQLIIDSLEKGIKLHELEVICRRNDKHKGSFRCSVAVEMSSSKLLHYYD